MKERFNAATRDDAETIGLEALAYLLAEPRRRDQFLAATGFDPSDLAANATAPHLLEAVLCQLMENEALLLAFVANQGLDPAQVMKAYDFFATDGGRARPLGST